MPLAQQLLQVCALGRNVTAASLQQHQISLHHLASLAGMDHDAGDHDVGGAEEEDVLSWVALHHLLHDDTRVYGVIKWLSRQP